MSARRILGAVASLCALGAFAAAPADARPPAGPGTAYPETLTTEHFQIHYTGALTTPPNLDRILHHQAGDLAANAERAYDLFVKSWGYPAPKNDGDGKVDIWVQKQPVGSPPAMTWLEEFSPPSTVYISIDPSRVLDAHFAATMVMFAIQSGIWFPADEWLMEASAEWAGFAADGYTGAAGTTAIPDISLDCDSDACGDVSYDVEGDSRWPFFQYLSDRYGVSFLKDVFVKGAALADPAKTGRDLLVAALADKNTTLGALFNDYTAAHVAGAYSVEALKGVAPKAHVTVPLGLVTATFPVQRIAVNHLAARYVKLARDPTNTGQCYAATLAVTVALPTGSASKPTLFSKSLGASALPLAINGSTASISVPWNTCATGGDAYLALPNPSLTADAQAFTVGTSLSVSSVSMTPPSTPPAPAYSGPVVAAPTTEVAPSILVHGSETIRVPAATRAVRLLVFSSGSGQLRAAVDSVVVGTFTLRPGNNDIRFPLPAALRTVSGTRASVATLSLTSLTSNGATAGETVTRKLTVKQPAAPKKASGR